MEIKVNSRMIIKAPTPAVVKWCKENLVLDNPEYYKRDRMGKSTWNVPSKIYLYETMGDELWLPFGCMYDIWKLCVRNVSWDMQIAPIRAVSYKSGIALYPYQEKAVDAAVRIKNGVLVMPCGAGKTQCGLEIISRISGKALWLTHTQDLLTQSKHRAESVLEIDGRYGTITAGKVDVGTHITFATVQTLAKRVDILDFKDMFDVIIVDECQHCCGSPAKVTQFYKVISRLSARYKIGLTATPKRADGLELSMFALLGGKIHEVTRQEVADTTCPIKVRRMTTGWYPDCECVLMGDGTIDYHKVVDNMINDYDRMVQVAKDIMDLDGSAIVLGSRIQYLQMLTDLVENKRSLCLSGMGQSKKAKQERKEALKRLNDGELDCIFATYQLAKEGLDVPSLRYVVFATPEKDETTIIQSAGRVGRKAPGKAYGTVIDYIDNFGMYKKWAKIRERCYKKIDAEVME